VATRTLDYRDIIDHLPEDATLVLHGVTWVEYEQLLDDIADRPGLRLTYDEGRLEIVSPSQEHEFFKQIISRLVQVLAETRGIAVETYGSATWRRRAFRKGTEPDDCFYVANAARIIGKQKLDLETDPPPDVAVEIDITSDSRSKFSIYAALGIPEIWRYDGKVVQFYELAGNEYLSISESHSFSGLVPAMLADALDQSTRDGQTAAIAAFRRRLQS
jgi:Uma2 family endonuclease